jgi:hypothetical protein
MGWEIFLMLAILLAGIVLVGHGCWVLLAAIGRALFGHHSKPAGARQRTQPNIAYDLQAFRRLILYLRFRELVDDAEWARLERLANRLDAIESSAGSPTNARDESSGAARPHKETPIRGIQVPESPAPETPISGAGSPPVPVAPPAGIAGASPLMVPDGRTGLGPAELAPAAMFADDGVSTPRPSPRRAVSEILQSFLAAHNIRWGELTAGILIVVCSIGLVTSLWSTLTTANRMLPAAVFLAAVAAIEGAGLYTLRRWKLRHTSRAVLMIATMLIPLSVMAGISVAGSGEGAVSLEDPMTWLAIVVGWVISLGLIFAAGQALVGPVLRIPWTLAIGLPTIMLPVIPAATRLVGQGAILVVGAVGLVTSGLLLWDAGRVDRRRVKRLLPARFQRLLLFDSMALYAIALLAAMLVLRLGRSIDLVAVLGITLVPLLITLVGKATIVRDFRVRGNGRVALTSTGLIAFLLVLALFPLMMQHFRWLISWGIVTALASIVVGGLTKRWALVAMCPIALAIVAGPAASVLLAGAAWESATPLWQRYLSGYDAIFLTAIGIATVATATISGRGATLTLSRRWTEHPLLATGLGIVVTGVVVAAVVGIGPDAWSAPVPRFAMTTILLLALAPISRFLTPSIGRMVGISIVLGFTWSTILFTADLWWKQAYPTWLPAFGQVLIATSLTQALFAELLRFRIAVPRGYRPGRRDVRAWSLAACVTSLVAALLIPFFFANDPVAAITIIAAAAMTVTAMVFRGRLPDGIGLSQCLSAGLLGTLVLYYRPSWIDWSTISGATRSVQISIAGIALLAALWAIVRRLAERAPRRHWSRIVGYDPLVIDYWAGAIARWMFLGIFGLITYHLVAVYVDGQDSTFVATAVPTRVACLGLLVMSILQHARWPIGRATDRPVVLSVGRDVGRRGERFHQITSALGRLSLASTVLLIICLGISIPMFGVAAGPARLAMIGWTVLLLTLTGAFGVWWTGRGSATKANLPFPVVELRLVLLVGCLLLGVLVAGLLNGPVRLGFAVGQSEPWIAASMLMWAFVGSIAVAIFGGLGRDRWLGLVAVGAPLVAAPALWSLVDPQADPIHRLLLFAWASVAVTLCGWVVEFSGTSGKLSAFAWQRDYSQLPSPLGECRWDQWVGWFGVVVAGCAAAVSTGGAIVGQSFSEMVPGVDSSVPWLLLGITATCLLVFRLTATSGPDRGLIAAAAIFLGAGLVAGVLLDYQWIANSQLTIATTWIWTLVSITLGAYGVYASGPRLLSLASLMAAGTILVNGYDAIANQSDWGPWATSTGLLVAVGALVHYRFGWLRSGQAITIFASLAATALFLHASTDSHQMLRMMIATYAAVAVFWGILEVRFGQDAKDVRRGPWVITAMSFATILCALPVTLDIFDSGFEGLRAPSTLTTGLTIFLLGLVSTTLWIVPNRRNAATTAYLATQTALAMVVGFWTPLYFPGDQLAVVALTLATGAGLWGWAWPILSPTPKQVPAVRSYQANLAAIILVTAISIVVCAAGGIVVGMDSTSRSMLIAAVFGFGLTIGAVAGWPKTGAENIPLIESQLPTASVLIVGSGLVLAAIGLQTDAASWALIATMRLFLVSIVFTPSMIWLARRVFDLEMDLWQPALRRGAALGVGLAIASLIGIFGLEVSMRGDRAILDVPLVLVIGTAVMLGIASGLAAVAGMFPQSLRAVLGEISDTARTFIIYAAQVLGGLTWLHLFLCRPDLALVGLRPYWPYTVMVLAFASAAITSFGHKRNDQVLVNAMRRSTLLLPLIPIIGFWLNEAHEGWNFVGGRTPYAVLLFLAALFYSGLSLIWQRDRASRVMAIVFGNAALWVVLVQTPSLAFASHPQFWLIPPAVCVLIATYLEQDRLPASAATAIRYAATLVIYISSTANIVISQVGATFWGPIVLILLALAGMVAGVVLRTRAFLYLGSLFVFIGVLSMVWQAGRAIDQSWPWWVFGITMGLMILIGLMLLEKNKIAIRRLATQLAQWQA